ncbi:MAG: hypothetical protein IJP86_11580 [Synergistaceae bacterium]|nr:hypothetical protein [Synergistaceae bacterium]
MTRRTFTAIFLALVLLCACYGLYPRIRLESANSKVAIVSDYREITALAKNSGLDVDEAIAVLKSNGLTGLMVSELIGDSIMHGVGHAEIKAAGDNPNSTEGTIITIKPFSDHKILLNEWLRLRFGLSDDKRGPILLTMPSNMIRNSGIIPDIDGLEAAKKAGLKLYYRPAPSPGHLSDKAALMLRKVHEEYHVDVFTPSGEYVSGYPDVSALANTAIELGIPLAKVEFSKQVGASQLDAKISPYLLSLHSVTNEEMTSRRLSRPALRDRMIRAAVERSVRLLLYRTAPMNTASFKFSDYAEEVRLLAEALRSHGFTLSWPETVYAEYKLSPNIFAALAMSAMMMFCVYSCLVRMGVKSSRKLAGIFGGLGVVLAVMMLKVAIVARIAGALAAPMIAVEASLLAMDEARSRRIIPAFLFLITGGLALASFFSVTDFMLRLRTFSGVKLTLMLPPVLVLLHDLKTRVHPESLIEFLSRPPLWGEVMLYGALLGAIGFAVLRSDNVADISQFETTMRESLEHLLIARPRTREVLVGYPSLLLWGFLVRNGYFARYREIFRVGAVLGFSSVINSFCHFHTPMMLILLREFNGLWTGLLAGLVIVCVIKFIVIPVLRLIRPVIS